MKNKNISSEKFKDLVYPIIFYRSNEKEPYSEMTFGIYSNKDKEYRDNCGAINFPEKNFYISNSKINDIKRNVYKIYICDSLGNEYKIAKITKIKRRWSLFNIIFIMFISLREWEYYVSFEIEFTKKYKLDCFKNMLVKGLRKANYEWLNLKTGEGTSYPLQIKKTKNTTSFSELIYLQMNSLGVESGDLVNSLKEQLNIDNNDLKHSRTKLNYELELVMKKLNYKLTETTSDFIRYQAGSIWANLYTKDPKKIKREIVIEYKKDYIRLYFIMNIKFHVSNKIDFKYIEWEKASIKDYLTGKIDDIEDFEFPKKKTRKRVSKKNKRK